LSKSETIPLPFLEQWQIRTKEYGENLQWAIVVHGDQEVSPGVAELLTELSARGVEIQEIARA